MKPFQGTLDLNMDLRDSSSLVAEIDAHGVGFLRIGSASISPDASLLDQAMSSPELRQFVKALSARGYMHYLANPGESRFVHQERLPGLWNAVRDEKVHISDHGIYYSLVTPDTGPTRRLVVQFGSMGEPSKVSSLWRYAVWNYAHLKSAVPDDTAILRIADVGGVRGAFYLDTTYAPENSVHVGSTIEAIRASLSVPKDQTVLLGPSKGGTGATFHGLALGLPFVAVDPVLDDAYYERELGDPHFTGSPVFLASKQEVFGNLFREISEIGRDPELPSFFVTSPQSAQYPIVTDAAAALGGSLTVLVSRSERIRKHEDVARATLGPTQSVVNAILCDWPLPTGVQVF
ncbi:XcbB/CpsF family capsular polysaccharide biosynthesis protein [Oerskovia sp. KBS0722]|uniref:XcbB/CpsF family capsular polysaccharide biosynthesis protein n=1 Tax=Oerskovia sp. KBS0722 TaxID=1179673 RepID=UPI00110D4E79|nr:XcbB/CpsF family capsular polysaccharide biosynthesis protein [Oerskovia sp. KBS0722]QDW64369.1 hypothetical protein FFI11_019335 [Oerskovia sp. KBS0722]